MSGRSPDLPWAAFSPNSDRGEPGEGARASATINTVQLTTNAFGAALAGVLVNLGEPSTLRSARLLLFTFAAIAVVGVAAAARSQRPWVRDDRGQFQA